MKFRNFGFWCGGGAFSCIAVLGRVQMRQNMPNVEFMLKKIVPMVIRFDLVTVLCNRALFHHYKQGNYCISTPTLTVEYYAICK